MSSQRPAVAHLLGSLRPSGMERMLVSAADYWRGGARSHLVIGQGPDHPFKDALEESGYRVVTIPTIKTLSGWRALRRLLVDEAPETFHIHTEAAFISSVLAASLASTSSTVRTVHNIFPVTGKRSWSRRLQARFADRRVGALVAPSADVADNEEMIGRHCRVVMNWVAPEFLSLRCEDSQGFALIVGNASRIKNHALALEAVLNSGTSLAYVGDLSGASTKEIALLDALQSEGRLIHRGPADPRPWFATAGVFLMPSLHEGMGVALAEALTVGLPSIVSDVPGLRWASALNGVTTLPLDVDQWTKAIPLALSAGRDLTRTRPNFSPARGALDYELIYEDVVDMGRSGIRPGRRKLGGPS